MTVRIGLMMCAVVVAAAAARPVRAQGNTAALVQKQFAEVSAWVTKSAEMVPADKYAYRPVGSVRTFGEQIGHIADAYNYFCAQAAGQKVEWADPIEKGPADKATLTAKLETATKGCAAAYAAAGPESAAALLGNISHTNLHYGNVIVYLRMLGLVPPSS